MQEEIQNCDICNQPVDVQSQHVFSINDVMLQGPTHVECWQKASADGGVVMDGLHHEFDNEAHFSWPPHDAEQFTAYREFLYTVQERVQTLPYAEDDLKELSYERLNKEHAAIFHARILRNPLEEWSEIEEQLGGEIARRDEAARTQVVNLTPEQYEAIEAGAAIRIGESGVVELAS
jgi:hypothetical protein